MMSDQTNPAAKKVSRKERAERALMEKQTREKKENSAWKAKQEKFLLGKRGAREKATGDALEKAAAASESYPANERPHSLPRDESKVVDWELETTKNSTCSVKAFLGDAEMMLDCAEERRAAGSEEASQQWLERAHQDLIYLARLADECGAMECLTADDKKALFPVR